MTNHNHWPNTSRHALYFSFIILINITSTAICSAQPQTNSADRVIKDIQQKIYILGEVNGGNPEEWGKAEQMAVSALREIARSSPSSLNERNSNGQTPLMSAAQMGLAPIVEELLTSPDVRNNLDIKGPAGTAWQQSMLAIRQSMPSCYPQIRNPFVFVDIVVTQPYYLDRNPYPRIRQLLEDAGADHDMEAARESWMNLCTTQSPNTKKVMTDTSDVQKSAIQLGAVDFNSKLNKAKGK
ncbi:ankyrin repeat protein [Methylorubrum rhodinum]|uniref:Ankyrin repeat protein n=1 Tax=Methylorubrum rhodinum TaxID=29428 RepID=A0A840ZSD5_9HYPH|nr:hypothetical protein [Methylorubrum rhodinum]MBB5759593.1 ankyrin repeat protein [Methylorubrum rhodinum]